MRLRLFCAAFSGLLLFGTLAPANDTLRLGGAIDGGTDTELVRWRGGYGYRGHYGGYGYRGGWGGWSGWGGRYSSPGFAFSYSRPYYHSWGHTPRWYGYSSYYRPFSYSYYRHPSYYQSPSYYYYPGFSYYYSPCVSDEADVPAVTLGRPAPLSNPMVGNPVYSSSNYRSSTFEYNGGPRFLIPSPSESEPVPATEPAPRQVPVEGRFVALPRESSGGVSPIIPETMFVSLTPDRPASPNTPPAKARFSYPAYGERTTR